MASSMWSRAARAASSSLLVSSHAVSGHRTLSILSARRHVIPLISSSSKRYEHSLATALKGDSGHDDDDAHTQHKHAHQHGHTPPDDPSQRSKDVYVQEPEFESLRNKINHHTMKALVSDPFNLVHMSAVQAAVLPLLPGLANPYDPSAEGASRDLLVKAKTGTGKTLAFLVPAVESRIRAIENAGKQALKEAGVESDNRLEERARRAFARNNAGTLIISPTRELAQQIAAEAMRLTQHHKDFGVVVFTGGSSKRAQMRDWDRSRRDIIVATPGRVQDVLQNEPSVAEGMRSASHLILDEADTLLQMGFREEVEAIARFLPPSPERQTFMFSATLSPAIRQVARSILAPNNHFIDVVPQNSSPVHAHIPQYHTVLPSAAEQLHHILRLIMHDQLTNAGRSKVIVFLNTTKQTQLFATLLRELAKTTLPASRNARIYELHSKRNQDSRTSTSDAFRKDTSGSAILVTSDVSARGIDYPGVTRVIQVGIPADSEQYVHRVGRTGRAGTDGRGDLVLLPWEMGFINHALSEVPLKPLTVDDLTAQVTELAAKYDNEPHTFWEGVKVSDERERVRYDSAGRAIRAPRKYSTNISQNHENLSQSIATLLDQIDEEAVKETLASLLGFYLAKSSELRASKAAIVQGLRDWTTEGCGLPAPPYISDALLQKAGFGGEGSRQRSPRSLDRFRSSGGNRSFGRSDSFRSRDGLREDRGEAPWMSRGSRSSRDDAPWKTRDDAPWKTRDDAPWKSRDDAPWKGRDDAPWRGRDDAPWKGRGRTNFSSGSGSDRGGRDGGFRGRDQGRSWNRDADDDNL
ncbi:DEAD-domain-containing protein [Artomyces pyxidatus]|uniref:DEAD-domain-containing protein n=1 Tax=Artomyces pyxidatus TaxID=48021 RepID=A0ACB8T9H6_9AGAM|nr:DEAD-domain-containing protein [Artomyces pyxidatus]